jgi:hypothetical protein
MGPAGGQWNRPNDEGHFFREKIQQMGLLRPFHLIDTKFTDGLFIEKKENEKDDSQDENLHGLLVSCNKIKIVGTRHHRLFMMPQALYDATGTL